MARPYTAVLRERVPLACERGGPSRASVAALFGVGEGTLCRWCRSGGPGAPREAKPHAGGPAPRLDEAGLGALEGLVIEVDGRTLAEYAAGPRERVGVAASAPAVCRALGKLGCAAKEEP